MTALDYAWACLLCDEAGDGQKADLEARKHTEATGHATTTHTRGLATLAQCIDEVAAQLEKKRADYKQTREG